MKIIAFYLPQFHEIPENNEWWGKGFTEWTNMKKAKPLFEGHYQPRIPLNNNYYNLLDIKTIEWQAKIAREAGIYGFCFYHYWFDGHMLLEKPVELFRDHPEIDMNYCISWANEDWTNAWVSSNSKTLISQTYGGQEQWEEHFQYFKTFFEDKRYILVDGKPLIILYRPEIIPCVNNMIDYWHKRALDYGFKGLSVAYQHVNFGLMKDKDDSRFDYQIEYQPAYARTEDAALMCPIRKAKTKVDLWMQKHLHKTLDLSFLKKNDGPTKLEYSVIWERIINRQPDSEKSIPGAFVDWDNTPRRGGTGSLMIGVSPDKFKDYLKCQIAHARNDYHKDMIFMFAWNEWAEGGYLEPDERYNDTILRMVHQALVETDELPEL